MSLLLDALKRAEQEKLAKQVQRPESENGERRESAGAEPAPAAASAPAPASRPVPFELQPISTLPSATPAVAANSARGDARAAQNVFNAKDGAQDAGPRKAVLLWAGIGVLVLVLGGAGAYLWYTMQSFTPRAPASARLRPAPLDSVATPLPPPNGQPGAFVPTQQPSQAIQPPAPAMAPAAPEAQPQRPAAVLASRDPAQETAAELLRDGRRAAAAPLKLAPSREVIRVPADVSRGFRSLTEGDLAAARRSYRAALDSDPTNLDALLGMATIEARGGNRFAAASFYGKSLAIDPRNATAQAGLAALEQDARPEGLESRLRADIAQSPQSAALRFALGNLFATQSRWNEAQVEFFEAFRLDPGSADLAFNLAVSLDHLKQPRLAAEYYARALEAARGQSAQFDPAAAARRLAQLRG